MFRHDIGPDSVTPEKLNGLRTHRWGEQRKEFDGIAQDKRPYIARDASCESRPVLALAANVLAPRDLRRAPFLRGRIYIVDELSERVRILGGSDTLCHLRPHGRNVLVTVSGSLFG